MAHDTTTPTEPGAHPSVMARLVEDFESMANLVDNADAATFAQDVTWTAMQRLMDSLEAAERGARRLRPTLTT